MTTYTLAATTEHNGNTCYTYRSDRDTTVSFRATNEAFSYVVLDGANEAAAVLEAFVRAGFRQHSFAGGFAEAIATLTV